MTTFRFLLSFLFKDLKGTKNEYITSSLHKLLSLEKEVVFFNAYSEEVTEDLPNSKPGI